MLLKNNLLFFLGTLFFHIILLMLFSIKLYLLYFIVLVISSYITMKKYNYFSKIIFLLLLSLILVLVNTDIYNTVVFDIYLNLNLFTKIVIINREVMYALTILHLLLLLNLKRFEFFWDIIDKKLFGRY